MSLTSELGLRPHELVSFVGAGGKTSLLLEAGAEIRRWTPKLLLGTTTKMSTGQIPAWAELIQAGGSVTRPSFLSEAVEGEKVIGSDPQVFDRFIETCDYVLVEADGARRRLMKAPAEHEPVIPSSSTTVVVVAGLEALGGRIGEVAHRPELVAELNGVSMGTVVTPSIMATTLLHERGGLSRVPDGCRVVVALTGDSGRFEDAATIEAWVSADPRVDRVVTRSFSSENANS